MTNFIQTDNPIDAFLDSKGGNVAFTPEEFKEFRELFVSKDVFIETQKSYAAALFRHAESNTRLTDTLDLLCAHDEEKEVRLVEVERRYEHEEECHQLTEEKVDRKIKRATMVITGGMLILAAATFVAAFILN